MTQPRISIIGLGKLGSSMAAAVASRGYRVIGVDVTPATVEAINRGEAPVIEPGLAELIGAHRARIRATHDYAAAIAESEITCVVTPTPSEPHGGFSLRFVTQAFEQAGRALAKKRGYHLFVLTSTVLPGGTRHAAVEALERQSGKRCGPDFGVCYNPAFIALGNVIEGFLKPDFILIGEWDDRAGRTLEAWYQAMTGGSVPIARMSLENAELTKLAINSYVTVKISFANMIAQICGRLPGGNADTVTAALGLDTRIGRKYLKGGLGYGGPCFPRDNQALAFLAEQLGCPSLLPQTTDQLNRLQPDAVLGLLAPRLAPGSAVAVLGASYKPQTPVVDESQGVALAARLAAAGHKVTVVDPLACGEAQKALGVRAAYATSVDGVLEAMDAVVLANPDALLVAPLRAALTVRTRPLIVLDCWRILTGAPASGAVTVVPVGIGPSGDEAHERLGAVAQACKPAMA